MAVAFPVVAAPLGPQQASASSPVLPAFIGQGGLGGQFAEMLVEELRVAPRTLTASAGVVPAPATVRGTAIEASNPDNPGQAQKAEDTARDFEALIIYQLLKQMWNSIPESGLFGKSLGGQFFREMWLDELSKQVSAAGGIGLAPVIQRELLSSAPAAKP